MSSFWERMTRSGNHEQADDSTGLSHRDVNNVKKSWAVLQENPEKHGFEVFLNLFQKHPSSQNLFKMVRNQNDEEKKKNPQFRAHVIHFMSTLDSAVKNIEHPQVVEALMHKLADPHARKHVEKKHFEDLKGVLADYLRSLKVKEEVVSSWDKFLNFFYKPMQAVPH